MKRRAAAIECLAIIRSLKFLIVVTISQARPQRSRTGVVAARTPDRPCRPKASRLDERGKALEQFSRRLADDLLWQDRSGKGAATTQAAAPD